MSFSVWCTVLKLSCISVPQIQFVAHTSASYAEVSLDDIELVEGICPPQLTCSFDDDSENCLWENYFVGDSLPWSLGSGSENVTSAPMYALLFDKKKY